MDLRVYQLSTKMKPASEGCSCVQLPVVLGCNIKNEIQYTDLVKAPHLLVSYFSDISIGRFTNALVQSLQCCSQPSYFRMEFISDNVQMAEKQLASIYEEMESRYLLLFQSPRKEVRKVRDNMPYIVVVVGDVANLINKKKMISGAFQSIISLTQKGRAAKIHLVINSKQELPSFARAVLTTLTSRISVGAIDAENPDSIQVCHLAV